MGQNARLQRHRQKTRLQRHRQKLSGGGDGAEDEFVLLFKMEHADFIWKYKVNVSGSKIPCSERRSVAQLSSVKARFMVDVNPAPAVSILGPYGDRCARALPHVEDVRVEGVIVKPRVTGPFTLAEWVAFWQVSRSCLLALGA